MTDHFDSHQGLIKVPVRVFGPRSARMLTLALDTGASMTMLSRRTLLQIGFDPETATKFYEVTSVSDVHKVPAISIDAIRALDVTKEQFPVVCHDLPGTATIDGVLGLNFFRGHVLTIDFRQGTLVLD